MFFVAGVSGNTGSVVASTLLDAGKQVRVLVREPQKGEPWRARGAEVIVGDLHDRAVLERALAGVRGAYLLIPPAPASPDPRAKGRELVDLFAAVLAVTKTPHVAYLSSIGAQHEAGTGPVTQHYYGERALSKLEATKLSFIRAPYFMENHGAAVHSVTTAGVLPVFGGGETHPFPMIATKDIGKVAAQLMLEPPAAHQVIELHPPRAYSFVDVAEAFSRALGKPVTATVVPIEAMVPTLVSFGVGEPMATLYREMTEGAAKGLMAFEGGSHRVLRGATTIDEVIPHLLGRR